MNALDLDADVRTLVGELPEVPCDEPTHFENPMHGGPGTHYVQWLHGCGYPVGTVLVLCEPMTLVLARYLATGREGTCRQCRRSGLWSEILRIIGPIKDGAS